MISHTRHFLTARRVAGFAATAIALLHPPLASGQACTWRQPIPHCLRLAESHHSVLGDLDLTVAGQAAVGGAGPQAPLLSSHLHLAGLDGRLRYELRYSFDSGDILAAHEHAQARLHTLAAERREQRWGLRLATLGGHPAVLEHRLTTQQRWTVDGLHQHREERTELRWQSPRVEIELRLLSPSAPQIDAATGLRCDSSASMALKPRATSAAGSVRLLAKGCELPPSLPGGDASAGAASSLELSYRREDPHGSDTIRFEQLAARTYGALRATRSYRFQWQHQRRRGAWQTSAQASLRHQDWLPTLFAPPPIGPADSTLQWAANASIAREVIGGKAFARWSSASMAGSLFTPQPLGRTDRLHLGLDLSRWLGELLPRAAPSLVMQWHGSVSGAPDRPRAHEQRMDVKVAMRW
ncbi:MAG: hypothetical protein AAGA68_09840 [Pseudomonadota bacterium]